jgi:hypothetical protein
MSNESLLREIIDLCDNPPVHWPTAFREIRTRAARALLDAANALEAREALEALAESASPWRRRPSGGWTAETLPGTFEHIDFLTLDICDGLIIENTCIRWYGDFEAGLFYADSGSTFEPKQVIGWRKAVDNPDWVNEVVDGLIAKEPPADLDASAEPA